MKPDVYGHCCLCHNNLIVPRIVDNKQEMMFSTEFDQTEFVISNNSRMVVCICKSCKSNIDLSDPTTHGRIMESVKLGWDGETGNDKRQPMDYHDLKILFHSENIDDYVVKNRINKLGKIK